MNLVINNKSQTPLYEQLYNQIVAQILSQKIKANQCLPSIRVVARQLQMSVIPVKTAYELLEKDGYIYTLQGKGCFVADVSNLDAKKIALAKEQLTDAVDYCKLLGLEVHQIADIVTKLYN